ncbi:MAG: ribosome biogenesis GTPase Der [Chloroflexi bacterium]|nr:ribosome biogenesis GTPase Der [Chloroflexota bacterium]MBV9899418.1 ribosome biogenesis GTPase Der [Chloroflexota bacterium]
MPIVALVGRPNVGKSTLFNRLIGEHRAVVHDVPGTTRDRLYGTAEWRNREFTVIDTGGIGLDTGDGDLLADVRLQAEEAMHEADVIVWVVDAASGLTAADHDVANELRSSRKPIIFTANKADNQRRQLDALAEYVPMGFGEPVLISALHGEGTGDLLDAIVDWFPKTAVEPETEPAVSLAIVGRPNVGKSSLVNKLVGARRTIVRDEPGTTRDAIDTPITRDGQTILLIDTAGVRRRGRIQPGVEKFSVLRTVRAIERSDVAILLIDATEGVLAQDAHVAGYVEEAAKGLVVAVNKWDLAEKHPKAQQEYTVALRRELKFADWAPVLYISAKTGQRVDRVLDTALAIQAERTKRIPTALLNDVVRKAVEAHPLTERGRALKIYYTAQTGTSPPRFTLFCNAPKLVHFSYVRYLDNTLRAHFQFEGTPLRLEFRGRREERRR